MTGTIKIIDLLNKIANDEEIPKKIKYENKIWYYKDGIMEYISEDTCFSLSNFDFDELDDEVEILEEEKKIPEKLETYKDGNNDIFLDDLCYKYMPIHKDSLSFNEQVIVDKLNEVLDYLKSKGE